MFSLCATGSEPRPGQSFGGRSPHRHKQQQTLGETHREACASRGGAAGGQVGRVAEEESDLAAQAPPPPPPLLRLVHFTSPVHRTVAVAATSATLRPISGLRACFLLLRLDKLVLDNGRVVRRARAHLSSAAAALVLPVVPGRPRRALPSQTGLPDGVLRWARVHGARERNLPLPFLHTSHTIFGN